MSELKGKSLRVFLTDGTPNGILTAEIVNWKGHVVSAPRTKLAVLSQQVVHSDWIFQGVGAESNNWKAITMNTLVL